MRIIRYASMFKKHKKNLFRKYPQAKEKILNSYQKVLVLLAQDLPLPDSYKAHIVDKENRIWELHLVSYSSDYLLLYKKCIEGSIKILQIYAITDHRGMNKILHSSVEDELLEDFEISYEEE